MELGTMLDVQIDGDNCWPDANPSTGSGFIPGRLVGIARLPRATSGGKSAVTVRVHLPDGQIVLAQTTLTLMENAIKAFMIAETTGR